MKFRVAAFAISLLFSEGFPDTTPSVAAIPCPEDVDWCRLEKESAFPLSYPAAFVDSLRRAKDVTVACSLRTVPDKPFVKGEKFVYDVRWGPISAGYAVLQAAADTPGKALVLTGKGMTNGFFSSFYKVRDFIEATIDPKGIYPFFFEQHIREGRYRADRWELFDQTRNAVFTHKKDADSVGVPPFVQNYFSMIYWVRSLTFTPGDSFAFDCFVDKRPYRLAMFCESRVRVNVEAGTFDCLLVKPSLVGEGRVFTRKDEILLWLTDDEYKMPVMAKARIKFGAVTGRLIWYERGK